MATASGRLRSAIPAQIIAEFSKADLAVIKIDVHNLPTISFNATDQVKQGELVIALGSPRGVHNSVSVGIVGSAERQIALDDHLSYVQTDAAINPGSSG